MPPPSQANDALFQPGRGVFFIASALVLFLYSFTVLLLDCQEVQQTAYANPPPAFADHPYEVRLFGVNIWGPWIAGGLGDERPRGLSEVEIERVGTLTTFHGVERGPLMDARGERKEEGTAPVEPEGLLDGMEKGQGVGQSGSAVEVRSDAEGGAGQEDVPQVTRTCYHSLHSQLESLSASPLILCPVLFCVVCGASQCIVCLDVLHAGDEVLLLPCAHMFHPACIKPWLRRSQACPSQSLSYITPCSISTVTSAANYQYCG